MTNYINSKSFDSLIEGYLGEMSLYGSSVNQAKVFNDFDLLITSIIESFKFKIDHEDAKQDCYVLIIKTLPSFSKEKGSAFNYFTTIIINNLRFIYMKNKKYNMKLNNYFSINRDRLDP